MGGWVWVCVSKDNARTEQSNLNAAVCVCVWAGALNAITAAPLLNPFHFASKAEAPFTWQRPLLIILKTKGHTKTITKHALSSK